MFSWDMNYEAQKITLVCTLYQLKPFFFLIFYSIFLHIDSLLQMHLITHLQGHNFNGPILVGQVLVQEVPHNEFSVEYGLKNLVSVSLNDLLHGLRKYRNKNEKDGREERSLSSDQALNLFIDMYSYSKISLLCSFPPFSVLFLGGLFTYYIGPLLSSRLYTC